MVDNTLIHPSIYDDVLALARGSYQQDLLYGLARWSGADLRGVARKYGARYAESRRSLLARIKAAGFHVMCYADRTCHGRIKVMVTP